MRAMGSFQGDFPSLVFLSIQYLRGMSGAGKRCQPNREVDAPVMSPRGKRRRHNPALVWEHSPTTHSSGSESRERPPLGSSARTATRLALLARLAAAPVVVSLRHTAAAERVPPCVGTGSRQTMRLESSTLRVGPAGYCRCDRARRP